MPSAENVGSFSVCEPLAIAGRRLPLAPLASSTFLPSSNVSCGKPPETSSLTFAPAASLVPAGGSVPISSPFFFAENWVTFSGTSPASAAFCAASATGTPASAGSVAAAALPPPPPPPPSVLLVAALLLLVLDRGHEDVDRLALGDDLVGGGDLARDLGLRIRRLRLQLADRELLLAQDLLGLGLVLADDARDLDLAVADRDLQRDLGVLLRLLARGGRLPDDGAGRRLRARPSPSARGRA